MVRFIQTVGIIGFFICLSIMYMTNHGVRGIQKYYPSFQIPDMRFHYSAEQITNDFERIGNAGRTIYQKYLYLDFVFIICFIILMLTISNSLFSRTIIRNFLFAICILRALFDILENSFLLSVLKNYPSINKSVISVCSYFTSFKFIMLYIWIFALIIQLILMGITKIKAF